MRADFSSQTMVTVGSGTPSTTERKALSTMNLVTVEIFFRNEGKSRHLQRRNKKIISNPALSECLKHFIN